MGAGVAEGAPASLSLVGPGHRGRLALVGEDVPARAELRMQRGAEDRRYAFSCESQRRIELVTQFEGLHAARQRRACGGPQSGRLGRAVVEPGADGAEPVQQVRRVAFGRHGGRLMQGDETGAARHRGLEGTAPGRVQQRVVFGPVEIQHHGGGVGERLRVGRPAGLERAHLGLRQALLQPGFHQAQPGRVLVPARPFIAGAADQHDGGGIGGRRQRGKDAERAGHDRRPPHPASTTQRKPMPPERSLAGAISRYLPCWSSR